MFSYSLRVHDAKHEEIQKGIIETANPVSSGDKLVLKLSSESLNKIKEKSESDNISETKTLVITQIVHYPKTSAIDAFSEVYVLSNETFEL